MTQRDRYRITPLEVFQLEADQEARARARAEKASTPAAAANTTAMEQPHGKRSASKQAQDVLEVFDHVEETSSEDTSSGGSDYHPSGKEVFDAQEEASKEAAGWQPFGQEALDSMTHGTGPIDLTNGDVGMAPGVQLTSAAGAGSKETTLAEQVAQPSDCHLKWNLGQFKQLPPAIVYVYRVQCFRWHVLLVLTLNLTDAAHIAIVHVTAPCAHPECVLQGSLAVRRSKRKRSEISSPDVQSKPLGDGLQQVLEGIVRMEERLNKRFEAVASSIASLRSLIDQQYDDVLPE
ncbi:hypothetical protein ABBQ38_007983 [Trebouxia sp. C0009 RCD-2024]